MIRGSWGASYLFLYYLGEDRTFFSSSCPKFRFIWPCGFRGEDLKKSANQKQELPVVAMFVN
jgi:hypothetical protein